MSKETKRVFEYGVLKLDDEFKEHHFERLVKYNEQHGNKFFEVGNKKIYFKQYVGVIQVGNVVIEILPKADNNENSQDKWHNALIAMLKECRIIKLESLTDAYLKIKSASLIDLYFETFLNEIREILNEGLVKKYRYKEDNLNKLKGRLLFSKHIAKNIIHKEKFYTTHAIYDMDNIFNRILKKALIIVADITSNQHLKNQSKRLLLDFEEISDSVINKNTFKNLRFSRNSERYRQAILIAKLIILEYSPDLKSGADNILAILFDMNKLFEKYIYLQLKKEEDNLGLTVKGQSSKDFWQGKKIKPDIIIDYKKEDKNYRLIVDTKWKIIKDGEPSDEDLRQMFAYNVHFNCAKSVLLYPKVDNENTEYKCYEESEPLNGFEHSCKLHFVELFDEEGKKINEIGKVILNDILRDCC